MKRLIHKGTCKTRCGRVAALIMAGTIALSALAGSELIADFGGADTSVANTFWNVSGYNGGSVWREASTSASGFSARSRTQMPSRGIPLRTGPVGMLFIVY